MQARSRRNESVRDPLCVQPSDSDQLVDVHDGQFLGRGASKRAFAARWRGTLVALLTGDETAAQKLRAEARLMEWLRASPHPHVLPLLTTEKAQDVGIRIVVPLAKFGSVRDLADHLDFEGVAPSRAHMASILLQVAHAVLHLNSLGIDHHDVSARNVLVFEFEPQNPVTTHVKLGDFGEARPGRASPDCISALAEELHGLTADE